MQKNRVIFFQIKEHKEKLKKIIQVSYKHFINKKNLLIKTSDRASVKFVDELLWTHPVDSFLPHSISEVKCDDFIVITDSSNNLNESTHLFNLNQDAVDLDNSYKVIYDFDDYTSKGKQQNSKKRFEMYKSLNYQIESH